MQRREITLKDFPMKFSNQLMRILSVLQLKIYML